MVLVVVVVVVRRHEPLEIQIHVDDVSFSQPRLCWFIRRKRESIGGREIVHRTYYYYYLRLVRSSPAPRH
jgi:hypothetical protein